MTNVNGVPHSQYNSNNLKTDFNKNDIELEEISILYTTEKQEDERSTFNETFDKVSVSENEQGENFLNGLIDNKETLMEDLNLTDDQYDSLACIALALASQETGMGVETGYNEENNGLGGAWRKFAKWADTTFFGGGSASSGLTQMKVYDFIQQGGETAKLLEKYGITADGVATNNLYDNPDKAAIATMVVLKSITENYDEYQNVLSTEHSNLEKELDISSQSQKDEAIAKGNEIISDISSFYTNAPDEKKAEIRTTFKQWLLSKNDSQKGDKVEDLYNEEVQLEKLNKLFGGNPTLKSEDLDYIRYSLTENGSEMNMTEYCAYAWNKGTGETGMQLDRLLADKIGTILSNPEDFDYDQFTVNVSTLAFMYANQSFNWKPF